MTCPSEERKSHSRPLWLPVSPAASGNPADKDSSLCAAWRKSRGRGVRAAEMTGDGHETLDLV
jgi:hypothetical protein